MADIYWYISAEKIQSLKKAGAKWDKFSFKFNLKFLEIDTAVALDSDLQRDLNAVKKNLAKDSSIVSFESLAPGKEPSIFSFEGEGGRLRTPEALWIAIQKRNSALLLVGAPRNLAGQSQLKEGQLSPSLDPIGAVKAAAEGKQILTLVPALSYAWREVMQDAIFGGVHFPRVEGLAVFAGLFHSDTALFQNAKSRVDRIVLGSPIYVRQI